MHTDQGLEGDYGLWVLKGWRPFYEIYNYPVPELLIPYFLAGWFSLFGASYLSFHWFFITLSMAAFPFIYWTFRQWAGPKTALLALAVMAFMRWNWIEPRTGYPSCQTGFFLFAGLAFWLHWILKDKKPSFYLSALFLGLGLYTYQIFKAVPLLFLFLGIYEHRLGSKKIMPMALWAGFFLLLALPLLAYLAVNHTAGNRESDVFIGNNMAAQHSLKPLWDQAVSNILMFNREGDPNPRHNLPGTRMLDDVTGVFFVLGLGLAWLRRKERAGFYPLAGFLLFLGVGALANDPANSNRLWILSRVSWSWPWRSASRAAIVSACWRRQDPTTARSARRFDGTWFKPRFDLYCGCVSPAGTLELGTHDFTAGRHRIRFANAGKNEASGGYSFGIDAIDLLPPAPSR